MQSIPTQLISSAAALLRPRMMLWSGGLLALALSMPCAGSGQEGRAPRSVVHDSVFQRLDARPIGPPGTSGRIASIEVLDRDPRVIWVGSATGGLWKSEDGGHTWEPQMDTVRVNSIGSVAVHQAAPHIVWVGTGEANTRNSMGVGRGVWKSQDGGRSWRHMGLERTEHIEAVVLHPEDPDVAWVSAPGPAWSDGDQRGVFKTTDGGETWRKVLYVDERTGAFELVLDPSNPNHLLASTWEHRRDPWFFSSGGEGSGLWKSYDGGESWARITSEHGLPEGELGRIGIAFSASDPRVAYALVEAEESALVRSEDGGETWRPVNTSTNVNDRPFYYSRVAVDPTNENRVYRISGDVSMSEDGGRTFEDITANGVHVDHHAFWTHPNGHTVITGSDGGVYFSNNRGDTWRFVENLPLAQFYHLAVGMDRPFSVYGGLQDNGSWRGPSEVWETPTYRGGSSVMAHHWVELGAGDGFAAIPDPTTPGVAYNMSQAGNLRRADLRTTEERSIRPPAPDSGTDLRFNWNSGLALDPFDSRVIYYGSQFLHRSPDRGESWEIISPDLTTDDPAKQRQRASGGLTLDVSGAENHTTILTIAPSPVERGVIWVGTDDGNVQVTRDDGATWTNVVERIPGVPPGTWVPHIEASEHDAGTAYVVFDNHRRGDWATHVYRTRDYGETWVPLSPEQVDGYVHAIEEDPVEPDLLFLGAEFGLYYSVDGGDTWRKWTPGAYPDGAPTRALVVHPRDHDLAVGTHGRGAWIVDDIRPLREFATDPSLAERPLHLFGPPPAVRHTRGTVGPFYFPGSTKYLGPNRPYGGLLSYWVSGRAASPPGDVEGETEGPELPVEIAILEGDSVIRLLEGPAEPGVNRVVWDLRVDPIEEEGEPGPEVLPGTYEVRVRLGDAVSSRSLEVLQDPRTDRTLSAMAAQRETILEGRRVQSDLARAIDRLEETRETLELYETRLADWEGGGPEQGRSLLDQTAELQEAATVLLVELRLPDDVKGSVYDGSVTAELSTTLGRATSTPDRPSPGRERELQWALDRAEGVSDRVDRFYSVEMQLYLDALEAAGFDLLSAG